jgi:hypothetical protein
MSNRPKRPGTIVLACALLLACALVPARAFGIDFLVPGMSLQSVSLVPGARVSYLVVSKSFGAADSSFVELRVLEHKGGAFRLEIVSSPYPRSKEESVTVRLRLSERVTSVTSSESFRSCMLEVVMKEGTGAFRRPTAKELDEMDIESIFLRPDDGLARTPLESARIAVPAGVFVCDGAEYSRDASRSVSLGGVEARRVDEEKSRIWLSRDVPLWGLVKSTVEKRSRTIAAGVSPSAARSRETSTESVLLSYTKPRGRS